MGREERSRLKIASAKLRPIWLEARAFRAFYGCTGYPDAKIFAKSTRKAGRQTVARPFELDENVRRRAKLVIPQGRFGDLHRASITRNAITSSVKPGMPAEMQRWEIAVKKSSAEKSFTAARIIRNAMLFFGINPSVSLLNAMRRSF
jgi:hypothetical protein